MRTIIAGGRTVTEYQLVLDAIEASGWASEIRQIVSGTAKGVDSLGERWANENGVEIAPFPPDWDTHGRAAGPIRNRTMAENADRLIAIWDGVSTGTKSMIGLAEKNGLEVFVHRI